MLSKVSILSFMGIGLILILSGNVIIIKPEINTDLIRGEDCTTNHGSYFLDISAMYKSEPNASFISPFSIILSPTSSDLIFSGNITLIEIPTSLTIESGEINRKLSDFSNKIILAWRLSGNIPINGIFIADIILRVKVPDNYPIHPGYEAIYSVELIYDLESPQMSLVDYFLSFKWIDIDLFNQLLSYLSYGVLAITSILGMPRISIFIRRTTKINVSNKKIRYYHCLLGKIVTLMIGIHVIVSSLSPMWFNIIKLWILPTIYLPEDLTLVLRLKDSKLGLELGRWAGVLIFLIVVGGIEFLRITHSFGKKWAIFLQQVSYLVLTFVALHALMLGTLARENYFFVLFTWSILVSVFSLRFILYIFNRSQTRRSIDDQQKTGSGSSTKSYY